MSVPQSPTAFTDSPVIAPRAGTIYRRANYISASYYRSVPTAVATNQLIPGDSNAGDNTNVLTDRIAEASAWIDDHCFHTPEGSLAASPVVETDWVKVKDNGMTTLICNQKPVNMVLGIALGPTPSSMTSLTTGKDIDIRGQTIEIPPFSFGVTTGFQFPVATFRGGVYAMWEYVPGFAHCYLTASSSLGATSLSIANLVSGSGVYLIYPGSVLTIIDGPTTETVIVAQSYVPGSATLPLVSGTQYAHTIPTNPNGGDFIGVTGLPRNITRACVSLTSAMIKTRGTGAQVLPTTAGNASNNKALAQAGAFHDVDMACKLLKPYVIVFMHAS